MNLCPGANCLTWETNTIPFLLRAAASNPDGFENSRYIKPVQNFRSYGLNFPVYLTVVHLH